MHSTSLKNDEGVSPVIGVILLVAITVILAAVIAAFVYGYAGSMGKMKVVSVVGDRVSTTEVVLIYHGGKDSEYVDALRFTPEVGTCTPAVLSDADSTLIVGAMVRCTGVTSGKYVSATARFPDLSEQVVFNQKF